MRKTLIILLAVNMWGSIFSQTEFSAKNIPDSLKKDAYSVVRLSDTEFTYQSPTEGTQKDTYAVTVLGNKGNHAANFRCYCDKFRDLKKFTGEIYDAKGVLIRKLKKSELKLTEYSPELASDGKLYYLEVSTLSYPFTVKYEWEVKYRNGIIGFPMFTPQKSLSQSVQKASYRLVTPAGTQFKYKAFNMPGEPTRELSENSLVSQWNIEGVTATESEPFGPKAESLVPLLYSNPIQFSYDGHNGEMSNWNTFGQWEFNLLKNRDLLSEVLKSKLRDMVKDAGTDKEKVKIVYDYLAKTTRYVSIQLGIGGLQPAPANTVSETGFGDCKGLSNYMSAMLKELGIPSYYTVISTDRKELIRDFASANQMNHVILQVPLPNDTLWLECTNAGLPFGYVHSDIAGHDALLIKESGGEIYRLPFYPDSLNTETNSVRLTLSDNGKVHARVTCNSKLFKYESKSLFTKLSLQEQAEYIRSGLNIPQAEIANIGHKEDKASVPSIIINYDIHSEQYGSRTGNRLFLPVNIFRNIRKQTNRKRVHDIYQDGYQYSDTILILIPETYEIESMMKPSVIKESFGTFSSFPIIEGDSIRVIQTLDIRSGTYPASVYPAFMEFYKKVSDGYNTKIVLRKKTE